MAWLFKDRRFPTALGLRAPGKRRSLGGRDECGVVSGWRGYSRIGGFQPLGVEGAWKAPLLGGEGTGGVTGGNFKDGFIGAGFAALLSPVGRGINRRLKRGEPGTGNSWQYLGRTATAATIGGTVAAISGGKFGNGAATAAFMHVVNAEVTGALERYGNLKAARMKAYQKRLEGDGVLELEVSEIWLEVEQMIERLAAAKSENNDVLTSDHVATGSDTAFAFGPLDRETGPVGFPVRIYNSGKFVKEVNSWELNYVGVGAAIQMRYGDFTTDYRRGVVVIVWNYAFNRYHQPMVGGKIDWATVGAHYARSRWRNGSSLNLDVGTRFSSFMSIFKRYVH
jgi:hypothetical protein